MGRMIFECILCLQAAVDNWTLCLFLICQEVRILFTTGRSTSLNRYDSSTRFKKIDSILGPVAGKPGITAREVFPVEVHCQIWQATITVHCVIICDKVNVKQTDRQTHTHTHTNKLV